MVHCVAGKRDLFGSLQEVKGGVPKRKEERLMPEGKGKALNVETTELYYGVGEAEGQQGYGFWKGDPLEPLKCKLRETRLPLPPTSYKTRAWHKGNTHYF